jgi:hypothetical protein
VLPNLIVIGAMKSGTSSLHHYLSLHPDIAMSAQKELNFFAEERVWRRGLEWYESNFPEGTAVRGESSPNYTKYPAFNGVPERLHATLPDAKLVYLLRDPIDRIVSHYIDAYSFGRENGSLEEVLADLDDNHYVNCSSYAMQLERYLVHFPQDRILVVTTEELRDRRRETLASVFAFLGVDNSFSTAGFDHVVYPSERLTRKPKYAYALTAVANRVSRSPVRRHLPAGLRRPVTALGKRTGKEIVRPTLEEAMRARLDERLAPDVARLRAITGKDFTGWSL